MSSDNRGRGCCFWGCLTLFVLVALSGGCTAFTGYRMLSAFTTTEPPTLPTIESDEAEWAQLQQELQAFATAYEANQPAQLSLTAQDINLAIAQTPETAGRLYFEIEDGLVGITGAYPIVSLPLLGERYVDGRIVVGLGIQDRQVSLDLREVEVNGDSLPPALEEAFIEAFNDESFLDSLTEDNKDWKRILREVDSLQVEGDRIAIGINTN